MEPIAVSAVGIKISDSDDKPRSKAGASKRPFVRLISDEKKYVDAPLHIARESPMLDMAIPSGLRDGERFDLNVHNISHRVLSKIVDYLKYRDQSRNNDRVMLEFEVDEDIAVDIIIAADSLGLQ